jgi:hypothetical protein
MAPYSLEKHVQSTTEHAKELGIVSMFLIFGGAVASGALLVAPNIPDRAVQVGVFAGLGFIIAAALCLLASVQLIRSLNPHLKRLSVGATASEPFVPSERDVIELTRDIANAPDGFPAEWLRCLTKQAKARLAANDLVGVQTILTAIQAASRHIGKDNERSDLRDTFELLCPAGGAEYCWKAAKEAVRNVQSRQEG